MSKPVISVENLSKAYRIGAKEEIPDTLVDAMKGVFSLPLKNFRRLRQLDTSRERINAKDENESSLAARRSSLAPSEETFWALKDVSFEVNQGDVVGIIGRNGAGKSTLLKILSRITEPTSGRAEIRGRVSSLLEVGTGFHPELTGRENVYMNGTILGMRKKEIDRKFDEIVDFSGVEKFLDTPTKRYSSGMQVRLAFAVAAHLEPEILIVDEVLAVGDVEFQEKCLGKMKDVAGSGRTIVFVSHNMNAIESLCKSIIVLEKGELSFHSSKVRKGIESYCATEDEYNDSTVWVNSTNRYVNDWFYPTKLFAGDQNGVPLSGPFSNDEPAYIYIEGDISQLDPALTVGYALYDSNNTPLYWTVQTDLESQCWPKLKIGFNRLRARLPRRVLNEGSYRVELMASLFCRAWICEPNTNSPSIRFSILGGLSDSPYWTAKRPGILALEIDWKSMPADTPSF